MKNETLSVVSKFHEWLYEASLKKPIALNRLQHRRVACRNFLKCPNAPILTKDERGSLVGFLKSSKASGLSLSSSLFERVLSRRGLVEEYLGTLHGKRGVEREEVIDFFKFLDSYLKAYPEHEFSWDRSMDRATMYNKYPKVCRTTKDFLRSDAMVGLGSVEGVKDSPIARMQRLNSYLTGNRVVPAPHWEPKKEFSPEWKDPRMAMPKPKPVKPVSIDLNKAMMERDNAGVCPQPLSVGVDLAAPPSPPVDFRAANLTVVAAFPNR